MTTATSKASDESQIRKLLEDRAKAVQAKDVEAATSNLAPNILSFDVVNPLQSSGSEASRKRTEEWFASFQGPIGFETRDLVIIAGEDVGFSHGLNHVSATRTDGGLLDMWWRTTVCFRKIDGKWMVTHEHNSVPFDVKSGMASLELSP
jgi:ketosteroid isomerase-like protein